MLLLILLFYFYLDIYIMSTLKNTQPYRIATYIQLKDGSTYTKRWLYFKPILNVDVDLQSSSRWKKIVFQVRKPSKNSK